MQAQADNSRTGTSNRRDIYSWAPSLALLLGLGLGLIPLLRDLENLSWSTWLARAVAFPLAGALLGWFLSVLVLDRRRASAGEPASELSSWAGRLRRRWPLLALALLLGASSLACLWPLATAQSRVIGFFEQNARMDQSGMRGTFHLGRDNPWENWCAPPFFSEVAKHPKFHSRNQPRFQKEFFTARWVGLLDLPRPMTVRLGLKSDDGSLLLLDGLRALDNLGEHGDHHLMSAQFKLAAGKHALEVLYFQNRGAASFELVLPPELEGKLHPLREGVSPNQLRRLSRQAQFWQARGRALMLLALLALALWLLPRPRGWEQRTLNWLKRQWPLLSLAGGAGLLMLVGLGEWPGLWGDEAGYGLSAYEMHWRGYLKPWWLGYCVGEPLVYSVYLLEQLFPLTSFLLRLVPVIWNLTGLVFLGLATGRLLGRRAGLLVALLIASSVWFLYFSRLATEHHTFFLPLASLFLYGLVRAREAWWGGIIAGGALGVGLIWHARFSYLLAGVGLMLLMEGRLRLLKKPAFWIGALAFGTLSLPRFLYFFGQVREGGISLSGLWAELQVYVLTVLPRAMSGELVAWEFSGELLWPVLPLAPLLFLALLLSWPWRKQEPAFALAQRCLAWLALGIIIAAMLLNYGHGVRMRYLDLPLFTLVLWLGVGLAGLAKRGGLWGRLALAAIGLVVVSNLATYGVNCLYAFSQSNGRLVYIEGLRSKESMATDKSLKADKRALYDALSRQKRVVSFYYEWDASALWFYELEEFAGCRGLQVTRKPVPGGLYVSYGLVRQAPPGAKRVFLGPKIDHNFQAWLPPPPSSK